MTNEEFKEKYYELLDNQIDDKIKLNEALEKNRELMKEFIKMQKEYMISLLILNEHPDLISRFNQHLRDDEDANRCMRFSEP